MTRKNSESAAETQESVTTKAVRPSEEQHLPRAPVATMTEAQNLVPDLAGDPVAWIARNAKAGEGYSDADGRGS
jgi:hypothetical protein